MIHSYTSAFATRYETTNKHTAKGNQAGRRANAYERDGRHRLVDTDSSPGTSDRVEDGRVAREEHLGGGGGGSAGLGKGRGGGHVVDERAVGDVEGRDDAGGVDVVGGPLLRVHATLDEEHEPQVGDTAVPVHASVVEDANVAVGVVVARDTILDGVVHVAESVTGKVALAADLPAVGMEATLVVDDGRSTHDIGNALVQGTGLSRVCSPNQMRIVSQSERARESERERASTITYNEGWQSS